MAVAREKIMPQWILYTQKRDKVTVRTNVSTKKVISQQRITNKICHRGWYGFDSILKELLVIVCSIHMRILIYNEKRYTNKEQNQ